ncbi:hypothetical protein PT974_02882 [Cladobotryum mycophilum]|uniref:Uncharacterized protein n=1 Tax=Cladobotryum mycophilum TaxID=491253 RepID=A0ABR0SZV7_9HYPO
MRFITFTATLAASLHPLRAQLLCSTEPPRALRAGRSEVFFRLSDAPSETDCEVTMQYEDAAFLPIQFRFLSGPCGGTKDMIFVVPTNAPNGEARIIWDPYCIRAVISGGYTISSTNTTGEGLIWCLLNSRTSIVLSKPARTVTKTPTSLAPTGFPGTVWNCTRTSNESDSRWTTAAGCHAVSPPDPHGMHNSSARPQPTAHSQHPGSNESVLTNWTAPTPPLPTLDPTLDSSAVTYTVTIALASSIALLLVLVA